MKICVGGATGLVGSHLMQILVNHPEHQITALTRKEITFGNNFHNHINQLIVDWDHLKAYADKMQAEAYICCLGTTIRDAGSPEAFKKVDYDYVLNFAKIAEQNNAKKLLVISANGADPSSTIFYSRIKGEMEVALEKLKIPQIQIFRPSLLIGHRPKPRSGEGLAQKIFPYIDRILIGPLEKYQSIPASKVAEGLYQALTMDRPGFYRYESNQIKKLQF